MKHRWVSFLVGAGLVAFMFSAPALAQSPDTSGPYARIAVLRPHDGDTVDFEAGYARHLEWHRRVGDRWVWYGWTIWAGDRQRSLVYATFGHSADSLSKPVLPAEDEVDNVSNVAPHASYIGNAVYEFLPSLSRGDGTPSPTPRIELTSVRIIAGSEERFEAALRAQQPTLRGETLWFRMAAGGRSPLYVRLRPRASLAELLESSGEAALPSDVDALIVEQTIEILNLRPTLSYGLPAARR